MSLGKSGIGFFLHCMDKVGEPYRILDKENRDVVADEIPIAFLGVELDRKAAHIAGEINRALAADHGGKADKGGGFLTGALEQVSAGLF